MSIRRIGITYKGIQEREGRKTKEGGICKRVNKEMENILFRKYGTIFLLNTVSR